MIKEWPWKVCEVCNREFRARSAPICQTCRDRLRQRKDYGKNKN